MARPKSKAPALRYHLSGQSVVTIDGRDFYLGKHGTPEALARYAVLIAKYQAGGLLLPADFSVSDLDERVSVLLGECEPEHQADEPILVRHVTASYRELAKVKYAEDQAELTRTKLLCDELDANDGDLLADAYGPLALQRQRQRWVDSGKSRRYVNRLVGCVLRLFKYAVSQELAKAETWQRLKSISPLRAGHTTAPERDPIRPVHIDVVRATAKKLSPVLKAMVRVHSATGMRPSELCRIKPCDIDRTGPVWMYRPAKHKTAGRGKTRAIPIVGDALDAIVDYMNRDPHSYCFSPAESVAWVQAQKRATRQSKVQPSQLSRAKKNPARKPGDRYTCSSYCQAIQRAAKQAGVEQWHPYQLRHLAGTMVRDALGIEAAQALLGHSHLSITEHYAKLSEQKAIEAAAAAPRLFD